MVLVTPQSAVLTGLPALYQHIMTVGEAVITKESREILEREACHERLVQSTSHTYYVTDHV